MRAARVLRAAFFIISPAACPRLALAELPAEGTRITSSDYGIDLAQTPVLSGNRVTGLAGAFVAIAEGTDGSAQNPAAVAHRSAWSRNYFDIDVGLGVTLSSTIPDSDLFNSGKRVFDTSGGDQSFVFASLAANLQFGHWGFGLSVDLQDYSLRRGTTPAGGQQEDELAATVTITHATGAYGFMDGQVLVGVGTRSITLNVDNRNAPAGGEDDLFGAVGYGYQAGVLVRPNGSQFRLGASFRSAVTARASGQQVLYAGSPENELVMPDRVTLPWDLQAGFALQLGPRPFNPRWLNPAQELAEIRRYLEWRARERARRRVRAEKEPARSRLEAAARLGALDAELETEAALDALYRERCEAELATKLRERYAGMERFYLLVTASIEVLGAVQDAVGVESFLERQVQQSGRRASVSPRLGVETEAVPNWTRIRAGSYLEPSRFQSNPNGGRVHATVGLEQRLISWEMFGLLPEDSIFRVTGSADVARAYFTWGFAIGLWH